MILVSACLAGEKCRYDGRDCRHEAIADLLRKGEAVTACPEVLGGLPVPREPCEVMDRGHGCRVLSISGADRTVEFMKGANETLALARRYKIHKAIMKAFSPSCGSGRIHDGSFSGKMVEGNGVTAELLQRHGIEVCTELDLEA